jgi:hypothetical protein
LVGITEAGETVLSMRTYFRDYFGDGMHSRLSDETPRYKGTGFIIRKEYFQRLRERFQNAPSYFFTK